MAVKWYGDDVLGRVKRGAMKGVVAGTEMVREEATDLVLTTAKSGRTYRRRGVTHRASAPGEPFASDTGTALKAIDTLYNTTSLSGTVNFGAAYAAALEFGTERMEPRPVARPALANRRDDIVARIRREVERAL